MEVPGKLEHVLQRELHVAHACPRATDNSETSGGHDISRISQIGVIRKIEGFETELKFMALEEPEIFQHGEIPIEYPGTWYRVAAGVPKCSKRLQHVRLRIEPATGISHSGIEYSRLTCGG